MRTFNIGKLKVGTLGDTHLGKSFRTDVPLHRRGDHEQLINEDFIDHMHGTAGLDVHVHMGDLFDKPIVSPEIVLLAYHAYREASAASPGTEFVVIKGNHDGSRDREMVTSFDVFTELVRPLGVTVVSTAPKVLHDMLFVPFNPWLTSSEVVEPFEGRRFEAAFGHWDLVNVVSDDNMIPMIDTKMYVTGHDHKAREEVRFRVPVICTGSMRGFAHGEGDPFRTVTLAELETISASDAYDLCLRVMLAEGEELPEGLDALQITPCRGKAVAEDMLDLNVEFGSFDLAAIFSETMTAHGVGKDLAARLFDRYRMRA